MNHSLSNQKGFTLIELIVVIGIIAILSTLLFTILNPLEQYYKAQDARRKSDLAQIQRALETYYNDHGKYPENDSSTYKIRVIGSDGSLVTKNWGDNWSPYMNVIPKDPESQKSYLYVADSTGQSYRIYASLNRPEKDPQACTDDGTECAGVPDGQNCGNISSVCTYGVSSPNTSP